MGYIPQDGYLFSGSIKENIAFAHDLTNTEEMIKAAKKAEIFEEIDGFSDKFETIIGERGVKLSGGQRQRLSIARTFYKNPNLFIFDDCLSAVDATKEKNTKESKKNKQNKNINNY